MARRNVPSNVPLNIDIPEMRYCLDLIVLKMTFVLKQYDHGYYQLNEKGAIFIAWYCGKNTVVT